MKALMGRTVNGLYVVCDKDASSEIANKIHALKEYSVTEIRWLYKSDQVTIMVYEWDNAREKIKEILNEYKD